MADPHASSRLAAVLGEDQDVQRWRPYVGRGAIRFYLPLDELGARPSIGTVADRRILPPKGHTTAVVKRMARDLGRSAAWAATHPHRLLAAELRPIGRGISVTWRVWRKWVT